MSIWATYIYEVYDSNGDLIYYGSTCRAHSTVEKELQKEHWADQIADVKFRKPTLSVKYELELLNRKRPKYHPAWIKSKTNK